MAARFQLKSMEEGYKGKAPGFFLKGIDLGTNQDKEYHICRWWRSFKDLQSTCKSLKADDILIVKMEKNEKGFWEVTSIEKEERKSAPATPTSVSTPLPWNPAPIPSPVLPVVSEKEIALEHAVGVVSTLITQGTIKKPTEDTVIGSILNMSCAFEAYLSGNMAENLVDASVSDIVPEAHEYEQDDVPL